MKEEYLQIGEIVRPQGIRGEVKLKAMSPDPDRYDRLETVFLHKGGEYRPCRVLSGRASGDFAYLKLEGVEDRTAAEALRGFGVFVDREHAITLPEGEHFICDLIGIAAETEQGMPVGLLKDVLSTGQACDVYVFDTPRGEMLMPALKKAILSVDVEAGRMVLCAQTLEEIACWSEEPAERDEEQP